MIARRFVCLESIELMDNTQYDERFYEYHDEGTRASAQEVVPLILELVKPSSVVDVGCGLGAWLAEFHARGIADIQGFDGSYVDRGKLMIDPQRFAPHDLEQPLRLDRRFDLAVCLEVAEHLPAASAATFVASLAQLSNVVLFSAATPGQGGSGHINEQWPEYWRERFENCGYEMIDCLRRPLWDNPRVKWWYRQNLFFYVERNSLAAYERLRQRRDDPGRSLPLTVAHRDYFAKRIEQLLAKSTELERTAMRASMRLRDINLIVFPDWTQPLAQVGAQLRAVFSALVAHPDHRRIALVINIVGDNPAAASGHLAAVFAEIVEHQRLPLADRPQISAVGGTISPSDWDTLIDCIQRRVALSPQDDTALAATGARRIDAITLQAIQEAKPMA
jgi:SAM-dependent methyltransferase